MLRSRLLVSAVLIPALIGLLIADAKLGPAAPLLWALCLFIVMRCGWECLEMLRRENVDPAFGPVAVSLVFLVTMTWLPHWIDAAKDSAFTSRPTLAMSFGLCLLFLMTVRTLRFREAGRHLPSLGAEVFTVAYVGLLICVTVSLRWLPEVETLTDHSGSLPFGVGGYLYLGALLFGTKMGDVGAYTLGRLFGKRKMSPHLSPGKTWAGAGGAVLGGVIGAALWLHLISGWFGYRWHHDDWAFTLVFGAVMGVVGLLGDLCESLIKRDAGVKDSAPLMPGFGGLLDLLDSILYAGPVAALMWQWFLMRPELHF